MADTLSAFSEELAGIVEAAGQSTVTVTGRRGRGATGVVWGDGLVLTSNHVLESDDNVGVNDGAKDHTATVVGRDPATDIAVLKVEGLTAKAAPRAGGARVGELVLAIGRPDDLRASIGVVGSVASGQRGWRGAGLDGLVLTDAQLYQGFSGGPLVNAKGEVVAINSWYYGQGTTKSLPVAVADRVAQSLVADGRVKQPYLGIGSQPVFLPDELRDKVGQDSGVMVISVESGSPAAEAGILQGDTLVGIDGATVTGMRSLFGALRNLSVGSTATLKLVRAGDVTEVKVNVGERKDG
ncbi:MAG: S1C family serine protease [Candidatus Dormibacteraeota bacterium]|nr:S1C family serine protease [Candidatus Dormibacteraeota bacterium]